MMDHSSGGGCACTDILVHTGFREKFEQLQLSEGAQAEKGMLKWQDLLDRDLSA